MSHTQTTTTAVKKHHTGDTPTNLPRSVDQMARTYVSNFVVPRTIAFFFFFNDPATPEISTLPLPDALPIFDAGRRVISPAGPPRHAKREAPAGERVDRGRLLGQ